MSRTSTQIIQRLGDVGLSRALDDVLDQSHLVNLANACGLKYPGMRTQSQSRERLLADLVDRAGKRENVRKAILRSLGKETGGAAKQWSGLDPEEKVRRLCDEEYLRSKGQIGLHLFLLASADDDAELDRFGGNLARARLLTLVTNGASAAGGRKAAREESKVRRQMEQRERKIGHLETQLTKSRESQKSAKSDLIQRRGELAESRMLVERLRGELTQAQAALQVATTAQGVASASDRALAELGKTVKKLTAEQKKLAHHVDRLSRKPTTRSATGDGAVHKALERLQRDLETLSQEQKRERAAHAKRMDILRDELRAAGRGAMPAAKPAKRPRLKGAARRVSVFIDVQNVYYAARKLKGKLDFDALLQAAVQERRLIKATAYVVESKETDQSQFIARLEQRGIEVQRKTLRVRADGSMKGDWDMELALDVLEAAPRLDVVVLVSGDGDFTSLVKRVKSMGPRVEVVAFPRNAAKSLIETADRFQPLDRKFMIYERRPAIQTGESTKRTSPSAATRK